MKPKVIIRKNLKEALLRKLFSMIKVNNYGESLPEKPNYFKECIIREIEYCYIFYYHIEYLLTENYIIPSSDERFKTDLIDSKRYYSRASKIYESIKRDLFEFCDINKNKDKYRRVSYSNKYKRNLILNSLNIVQEALGETRNYNLYNAIYAKINEKIEKIKKAIVKESVLSEYIEYIENSRIDFVYNSKDGELYYPVIVDMYLDYTNIEGNVYINKKEIKRRTKRYTEYMDKLKNNGHEIDEFYYYFMKFCKKERPENIKKYVLQFYLDNFNNNENINTLFRKLHLDSLDNDKRYTQSDMKKYTKKIHNVFVLGPNISRFI